MHLIKNTDTTGPLLSISSVLRCEIQSGSGVITIQLKTESWRCFLGTWSVALVALDFTKETQHVQTRSDIFLNESIFKDMHLC